MGISFKPICEIFLLIYIEHQDLLFVARVHLDYFDSNIDPSRNYVLLCCYSRPSERITHFHRERLFIKKSNSPRVKCVR